MPIRAILFDLDDTLFDTHTGAAAAMDGACVLALRRHPELSDAAVRSAFRAALLETEERLLRGSLSGKTLTMFDLYGVRWRQTLEACGAPVTHAQELADEYLACRRRHYRLFPDVPEVLPQLVQRYRVALLTNGLSDFQREKIRSVDLERWIRTVYVSSELDHWKPSPQIFEHVLSDLGCRPAEVVMAGDSLRHDIAGAASAGLRTIWVRRHGQAPRADVQPDATVEDLYPLPEVLEAWAGERS